MEISFYNFMAIVCHKILIQKKLIILAKNYN